MLVFTACDEQHTFKEEVEEDYIYEEDEFSIEEEKDYVQEEDYDPDTSGEIPYDEEDFFVQETVESYRPEIASIPPIGDVISDSKWDEITEGVSFERTENEKKKDPNDPTLRNPGWNFGSGFETGLSTVAWVLVIALIIGFLVWLMARTKVDTSVKKIRDFTVTDELLAASKGELEDALAQNLNRQDYRAAIRYRFGQLLQAMRKEGLLVWVPGRTNSEYQSNLQSPFAKPFGGLAKAFSYAMYSGREVTQEHYNDFANEANSFLNLFSSFTPNTTGR